MTSTPWLPLCLSDKESTCDAGDVGSISRSGRFLGKGNSNPLQYSYLENPMDRGAWQVIVHADAKSGTRLNTHTHDLPYGGHRFCCELDLPCRVFQKVLVVAALCWHTIFTGRILISAPSDMPPPIYNFSPDAVFNSDGGYQVVIKHICSKSSCLTLLVFKVVIFKFFFFF